MILAAIGLTVFLGFTALAIDAGLLYVKRRQMQSAADGAAIAGANALLGSQSSSYQNVAQQVASLMGLPTDKTT
ncbi:MAG: hypothetical protein JOZ29_11840 [Deltaproteobacteria bacterium]|nr:hypothetical protein [Deltaproteobacteria bacterium]MBV8452950.1 hypothetical protein [Deltaproteobacteria bacterium]